MCVCACVCVCVCVCVCMCARCRCILIVGAVILRIGCSSICRSVQSGPVCGWGGGEVCLKGSRDTMACEVGLWCEELIE